MQKVTSRTTALALLTAAGVHTKKKLSQNFLIDENIARKIVMQADIQPEDVVVEVGPGIGALSQILAPLCRHCVLIELDAEMAEILKEVMAPFHNVQILHADALRCDYAKLLRDVLSEGEKAKLLSNVPYHITSPLLEKLFANEALFSSGVVMVQLEVARRIMCGPGEKDYSSFSAFCAYHAKRSFCFRVSRNVFLPAPKVDSAVLRLDMAAGGECARAQDEALFFSLLRRAFQSRRKTLVNALAGWEDFSKEELTAALCNRGFKADVRAEKLSCADFVALSDDLAQLRAKK